MDLLVIGASGLVGSNVMAAGRSAGHSMTGTYRDAPTEHTTISLDKTDGERTARVIGDANPDAVVDTAAYHEVDACETNRERAWRVNAQGTRNAAIAADAVDAHFVYVSTDYVFGGDPDAAPFDESDPVSPVNFYARTKYAGEVAATLPERSTTFRPSVVYGPGHQNFATWALGELEDGRSIDIVDDQVSCPTDASDLAGSIVAAIESGLTGVYHAAGPRSLSRYQFTVTLAETCGIDASRVRPIDTAALGQTAPRPADSSLDSTKLYDATGVNFRPPAVGLSGICASDP